MSLLGWKIEEESMDIWEPEIHDWSSPEETSAFFGAAVAESHYTDDVVIDSCTSSRVDDEEDAEDLFERHLAGLGEDVHTFDVSRSAETRKGSGHTGLSVRIEGDDRVGGGADVPTDSVVSTPEVLEEVITLECDDQFQLIYGDSFPQTADDLFVTRKQLEEDEYVVEFVDATHFEGFSAASSNENTMDTTTTTPTESSAYSSAVEEEDTDDEEYTPVSSPQRRTTRRSNKHVAIIPAKRGRPAKPLRTTLTARELANLAPEAKKHKELRFKNNEASRLSRFKRRQKDLQLNDQCENYERENVDLRKMLKRHKKLHKELRAMIVGIKIR